MEAVSFLMGGNKRLTPKAWILYKYSSSQNHACLSTQAQYMLSILTYFSLVWPQLMACSPNSWSNNMSPPVRNICKVFYLNLQN